MASGFNINVKVNLNSVNKIIKDHGLNENGRVVRYARDEADRLMNPFVPFENGGLRRLKSYPNNSQIKYISPYSHYQYTGLKAKGPSKPKGIKRKISSEKLKHHTPGTGPEWEKLMMEKKGKELVKDIQDYIKKGN